MHTRWHHWSYRAIASTLFCFFGLSVLAQKTGKVYGIVSDKQTGLGFVTVTLSKMADTGKVVYAAVSDSVGFFSMDKVDLGDYLVRFSLITYKPAMQQLSLTAEHNEFQFPDYPLTRDTGFLQAVTVTSSKKLIEKTVQGFIVNAAANITSPGGTATDLLRNTPTVNVDAEGAITIRGKMPLVLINGRNSNLANLNQIPASSIESVEIINNPGASYDASAETGIINIQLKKNKQDGTNGALALGGGFGSRGRVNSSALINHKTKKWDAGLAYDNRYAGRTRKIQASRTNFFLPDEYLLNQNRNDKRLEQLQNLKLNLDFSPDDKNSLSFEAIGNLEGQDNNENLNSAVFNQNNNFASNTNRHSIELERSKVAELALDYKRKFSDKRKSISANFSSSINRDRENTDITSVPLDKDNLGTGNPYLQKTHNYENGNTSRLQVDYALPVSKKALVEAGYKGIYRNSHADYNTSDFLNGFYVINGAVSNIFNFNEQVHAVYATYSSSIGRESKQNWKYNLGLRAEQIFNNGNTKNNSTSFNNRYLKLFPTANVAFYMQPNEYWKLAYGKRINRPGLGQLNPFIDITDSLNPHSGNPYLQPEVVHTMEVGYNKEWSNLSLTSNLFYRYGINTIQLYSHLQSNGANLTFPENIGSATTYGIESIFDGKISKIYDFDASLSLFEQKFNGNNVSSDAVQDAFGWYAKLINNIMLWQDGKLQVTGNYTAAMPTPQGRKVAQYFVDIGFQQKIGKGNGRLGLIITDVFNSFKSGYINNTQQFSNYRYNKADTRAFVITFAWFFKSAFKEKLLENKFSTEY